MKKRRKNGQIMKTKIVDKLRKNEQENGKN